MKVRAKETIDLSDSPEDHYFRKNPQHYDNTNGSLYKIAKERNWNAYVFDIVKRLDRAEKKGEFITDIEKSIKVLELYLNEQKHRFDGQVEYLNK
jgi:hypothetical protein